MLGSESNMPAHVAKVQLNAHHMQHNEHQVQHVMCHFMLRDGSAITFDKVEIAFLVHFFF